MENQQEAMELLQVLRDEFPKGIYALVVMEDSSVAFWDSQRFNDIEPILANALDDIRNQINLGQSSQKLTAS